MILLWLCSVSDFHTVVLSHYINLVDVFVKSDTVPFNLRWSCYLPKYRAAQGLFLFLNCMTLHPHYLYWCTNPCGTSCHRPQGPTPLSAPHCTDGGRNPFTADQCSKSFSSPASKCESATADSKGVRTCVVVCVYMLLDHQPGEKSSWKSNLFNTHIVWTHAWAHLCCSHHPMKINTGLAELYGGLYLFAPLLSNYHLKSNGGHIMAECYWGAQPPRSPKSLTQHCDDYQLIKVHLVAKLLSSFFLLLFLFCAHRAHHFVQYCLKWFNKHFVLQRSVIILQPSPQPMALRISPILSTPHFILLHAGCFTVRQRQWRKATGKVVPRPFPEKNQTDSRA